MSSGEQFMRDFKIKPEPIETKATFAPKMTRRERVGFLKAENRRLRAEASGAKFAAGLFLCTTVAVIVALAVTR